MHNGNLVIHYRGPGSYSGIMTAYITVIHDKCSTCEMCLVYLLVYVARRAVPGPPDAGPGASRPSRIPTCLLAFVLEVEPPPETCGKDVR
jgi:hypothetical protein